MNVFSNKIIVIAILAIIITFIAVPSFAANTQVSDTGKVILKIIKTIIKVIINIAKELFNSFGDAEIATPEQLAVVATALGGTVNPRSGYCQAWVADVYKDSGANKTRQSAGSATKAANSWTVSTDMSKVKLGATVYAKGNSRDGHVGINVGNGMIASNVNGKIKVESIESFDKNYTITGWGWNGGKDLSL